MLSYLTFLSFDDENGVHITILISMGIDFSDVTSVEPELACREINQIIQHEFIENNLIWFIRFLIM